MRKQLALTLLATMFGCGGSTGSDPLKNIDALVILQRAPRMGGIGDVFQYTSYVPGARLIKLEPPSADGKVTELCCAQYGAEFADMDIQSYDLAFDATSIVMSARLAGDQTYGLYVLTIDPATRTSTGAPVKLATDPMRDYVYPIYAPGGRIVFVTNSVVEPGAKQHRDEYERGETTQLGSISVDGTNEVLGPRNLSHRVAPTMLHTGHVLFTQWDHLGDENSGHLMIVNADMTNLREAFGKENTGRTNSYLKAVEFPVTEAEKNNPDVRLLTIGTSRDRTLQSGKVLDVKLGKYDAQGVYRQSEANASFTDLTPLVPADREPSQPTIGRYYDAFPVRADDKSAYPDKPFAVVSWADGPVEESVLATAGLNADFGIYLYDGRTGTRRPIFNDEGMWDVMARPFGERVAPFDLPAAGTNGLSDTAALIGSLNVYDSSVADIAPGSVVRVRILEGFSVEEGVPDDFGLTEHEGAALVGEAPVFPDGSWAALVPANVPLHLQPIDKFGMAIVNEPVWFSAKAGESRFCGGCHEDRAATTVITPGITMAITDPSDFDRPRAERFSTVYSRAQIVGVPWEDEAARPGRTALQTLFTNNCATSGCHDGSAGAQNPEYTIVDNMTGERNTIRFDLRGGPADYGLGTVILSGYSRSHLTIMGPMLMDLEEAGIDFTIEGEMKIYCEPGNARGSELFTKLNPPQMFPYDPAVRMDGARQSHLAEQGRPDLTEDEYYMLALMCDAGGQFYSRENAPGGTY